MTDILVPAGLWTENDTAVISSWLYGNGEAVQAGTLIAEIMVEKSSFEVTAPDSGVLTIGMPEESEVQAGQVIGFIC